MQRTSPERLFDAYIFDMDGTIYLGDHLLPGARRLVEELRARSIPVRYLTNNPTKDPSQYADENPCVAKNYYEAAPSWDDVADYADGVVNPILIRNDDVYVYRGVNEEAALSREHGYPTHIGTSPRYHGQ